MDEEFHKLYSDEGVYGDFTYGSPFISKGLKCAVYLSQIWGVKDSKILCVGSGNGYEAAWFIMKGNDVTTLEIYCPDVPILKGHQVSGYAQDLPFEDNEFDLYFCCEMLEHVPEELGEPIIREAKRVAKKVFFTIATEDDAPYCTHINIHQLDYWYEMFNRIGFDFTNIQYAPSIPLLGDKGIIVAEWGDGVLFYGKC